MRKLLSLRLKKKRINYRKKDDYDKLDMTIVEKFDDFMNQNVKEEKKEEPIINIDNDSVIVGDVTDDQYYDDFFMEDDN